MARHYDNEIARRVTFNKALDPFILKTWWSPEITMSGDKVCLVGLTEHCNRARSATPVVRRQRRTKHQRGSLYAIITCLLSFCNVEGVTGATDDWYCKISPDCLGYMPHVPDVFFGSDAFQDLYS